MATLKVGLTVDGADSSYITDGTADEVQINTAIAAASSGDIVSLVSASYTLADRITHATGITLKGLGKTLTTISTNGAGYSGSQMILGNGVDDAVVRDLRFDGGVGVTPDGVNGVAFNLSDDIQILDVDSHNAASNHVVLTGCAGTIVTDVTITRDTEISSNLGHGFDIDASGGTISSNITITRLSVTNMSHDAFKMESTDTINVIDSDFHSRVVVGDDLTPAGKDYFFTNCTFDERLITEGIDGGETLTLTDCTFTRDGGVILVHRDDILISLIDCIFNGRNAWLGYTVATVSWAVRTNVTETNTQHPGAPPEPGKTMFACYNSTGPNYDTAPHVTPDTAQNNYEELIENPNVDENNMHYALLSDRGINVLPADETAIARPAAIIAILEGYPGIATVDISAYTSDWSFDDDGIVGSVYRDFKFIGTLSAGQQILTFRGGDAHLENIEFNSLVGLTIGACIEVRQASQVTGKNVLFDTCSGSSGGSAVFVQSDAAGQSLFKLTGSRAIDCSSVGGGIIRAYNTATDIDFQLIGMEFIDCVGGTDGAVMNDSANATLANLTFVGCTGDDEANITTATATLTNIIGELNADFASAGTITFANSLIGDGIGSHADGGNNITGSPTYVDSASDDYGLTATSEGLTDGKRHWTGPEPIGFNGEPFSDMNTDIGANQSTHSPNHPVNI